jgi:Spy/CpxP family protein refolding chaperone
MIMRKSASIILVIAVAAMFSATLAFAMPGEGGPPPGPDGDKGPNIEKMAGEFAKTLKLTKQQKEKFIKDAKEIEKSAKESRKKDREIMKKMDAEMLKESPDLNAIHGYLENMNKNRTESEFKRISHIIQFRKELTPDQRKKLDQIFKDREKRDHKGWKKGR